MSWQPLQLELRGACTPRTSCNFFSALRESVLGAATTQANQHEQSACAPFAYFHALRHGAAACDRLNALPWSGRVSVG
jgi:hypothetical protein